MAKFWHFSRIENKKILKKLLYLTSFIFKFIDFYWPKKLDIIIFGSNNGFFMSGSPKYFYEYIQATNQSYRVFFYLPFQEKGIWSQIRYIISFAPVFFSAKALVSSHPPFDFVPFSWSKRKYLINTGHGIPLKCMSFCDPGASKSSLRDVLRMNDLTSFNLVASSLEAALITRCFLLDPRKIIFTGHPRNDHLVRCIRKDIVRKILPNLPAYSTLILYCPTYRRNNSIRFFPFDEFNSNHLNLFLEEHRIVILTRGHVQNNTTENAFQNSRIIELGQDLLHEINDIFPEVDILITDYSSIFFDFLVCNKPCIFIPYDREEYVLNVGLLFDDYDYWTPGKKVYTYPEFIGSIEEILSGHDEFKTRREDLRALFHYYQTENTSGKILHILNKLYYREK